MNGSRSTGLSPVPVSLPLNSSPYAADSGTTLLQPTQPSPHSPRPSSSGAMLDMSSNGYHRACSPSSLSGGSGSPSSLSAAPKAPSVGKAASPPHPSRNSVRVVVQNTQVHVVRLPPYSSSDSHLFASLTQQTARNGSVSSSIGSAPTSVAGMNVYPSSLSFASSESSSPD